MSGKKIIRGLEEALEFSRTVKIRAWRSDAPPPEMLPPSKVQSGGDLRHTAGPRTAKHKGGRINGVKVK